MATTKLNIHQKLSAIQVKLKAPKNQRNTFGNYSYRSLEDIYEGLKPLLDEYKCHVTVDNKLMFLENYERANQKGIIFRESIASIVCADNPDQKVTVTTFTQESLERKGMSSEQCSGSSASYSDKYALNKLFCIDDNKDADFMNNNNQQTQQQTQQQKAPQKQQAKTTNNTNKKLTEKQVKRFHALRSKAGAEEEKVKEYVKSQGFEYYEDMSKNFYDVMCEKFELTAKSKDA